MRPLSAVEPLWLFVGDVEGEGFLPRSAIRVGSEAGPDAAGIENARVVEAGLCEGVVPLAEVEVDHVSNVGNNVLGGVLEEIIGASDYDGMGLGRAGGRSLCPWGLGGNGRRLHGLCCSETCGAWWSLSRHSAS